MPKFLADEDFNNRIVRGMTARRILDGIVRNVYRSNPGKLAAWNSASHVEKASKKRSLRHEV